MPRAMSSWRSSAVESGGKRLRQSISSLLRRRLRDIKMLGLADKPEWKNLSQAKNLTVGWGDFGCAKHWPQAALQEEHAKPGDEPVNKGSLTFESCDE
eukprot:1396246-Amphidinium_carterae.1